MARQFPSSFRLVGFPFEMGCENALHITITSKQHHSFTTKDDTFCSEGPSEFLLNFRLHTF